jgi:hypothetical protein
MTRSDLELWLVELDRCPATAVEMPLLLELHRRDPGFVATLPLRAYWQLLYGLHITLLDYTSASFSPLGLEIQHLQLPVRQLTISLQQLVEALAVAEFAPNQIAWEEELDVELTQQELAGCDQALTAPEFRVRLDQVLRRGLAFLEGCDLEPAATNTPLAGGGSHELQGRS